jgi:hypothetical protein
MVTIPNVRTFKVGDRVKFFGEHLTSVWWGTGTIIDVTYSGKGIGFHFYILSDTGVEHTYPYRAEQLTLLGCE